MSRSVCLSPLCVFQCFLCLQLACMCAHVYVCACVWAVTQNQAGRWLPHTPTSTGHSHSCTETHFNLSLQHCLFGLTPCHPHCAVWGALLVTPSTGEVALVISRQCLLVCELCSCTETDPSS